MLMCCYVVFLVSCNTIDSAWQHGVIFATELLVEGQRTLYVAKICYQSGDIIRTHLAILIFILIYVIPHLNIVRDGSAAVFHEVLYIQILLIKMTGLISR
jgi:hypothetical protein